MIPGLESVSKPPHEKQCWARVRRFIADLDKRQCLSAARPDRLTCPMHRLLEGAAKALKEQEAKS